jgi:hypothetical protein
MDFHGNCMGFYGISLEFYGIFMGLWILEQSNKSIISSNEGIYNQEWPWISLIKQCSGRPTLSILQQVSAQFLAYIPISVRYIRYRLQIHASHIYIYIIIYLHTSMYHLSHKLNSIRTSPGPRGSYSVKSPTWATGPATYFPNDYHSSFVMVMMMMVMMMMMTTTTTIVCLYHLWLTIWLLVVMMMMMLFFNTTTKTNYSS